MSAAAFIVECVLCVACVASITIAEASIFRCRDSLTA